jgi:hypothetical protein
MVCWPILQEILTDINAYCNNKLTFRQEVALVVFGGGPMLGAAMAGWRPRPHVAGPDQAMTVVLRARPAQPLWQVATLFRPAPERVGSALKAPC